MPVEAHQCPSCGAPLQVADQKVATVCIYCNSALVVTRDESDQVELRKDEDVDEETVERIKAMLLLGQREQAIALFDNRTGRGHAASVEAIDEYASHVVRKVARKGTLSWLGFIMLGTAVVLTLGGAYLVTTSPNLWGLGLVAMLFGGLPLLTLGPAALRTIRYLSAEVGEARIIRHAYIGNVSKIHSYQLLLEITGPGGQPFQTELPFPVSERSRSKIAEGMRFLVKYFPDDPGSVIFHRHLER